MLFISPFFDGGKTTTARTIKCTIPNTYTQIGECEDISGLNQTIFLVAFSRQFCLGIHWYWCTAHTSVVLLYVELISDRSFLHILANRWVRFSFGVYGVVLVLPHFGLSKIFSHFLETVQSIAYISSTSYHLLLQLKSNSIFLFSPSANAFE